MPQYFNNKDVCNKQAFQYGMYNVQIDEPNFCPFEGKNSAYKMIIRDNAFNEISFNKWNFNRQKFERVDGYNIVIVFQCLSCKKFSVIEYRSSKTYNPHFKPIEYSYHNNYFQNPFNINEINKLNEFDSHFIKIFKQANLAEQDGYNEIFPIGYRKALESLIKTVLIKMFNMSENNVIKDSLGINNKELIKKSKELGTSSTFATWLGNDYAHFVKKDPSLSRPDGQLLKTKIINFAKMIVIKLSFDEDDNYING